MCQATLLPDTEDHYSLELPCHHVGGGTRGWLVVPARHRRITCLQVSAHGVLDETPDQQRDQQDQAQCLDTLRSFQEQRIDDLVILEETEVSLDSVTVSSCPRYVAPGRFLVGAVRAIRPTSSHRSASMALSMARSHSLGAALLKRRSDTAN